MPNQEPPSTDPRPPKPPLRIAGIVFAMLINLVLISLVDLLATTLQWPRSTTLLIAVAAALLAGVLTTFYVGRRSGIHAFLGGMISIPLIAFIVFAGDWQAALYAGAFCALGGLLMEKFGPSRYRTPPSRRNE